MTNKLLPGHTQSDFPHSFEQTSVSCFDMKCLLVCQQRNQQLAFHWEYTKCEHSELWRLHKVWIQCTLNLHKMWTQWTLNIAHGTMRCHSGLCSMSCCTAPRCLTHIWHIVGNRILVWLESWPKWVGYWGRCHVLQWSLQPKCNSYKNTTCTQCQF